MYILFHKESDTAGYVFARKFEVPECLLIYIRSLVAPLDLVMSILSLKG